jgi:hypothetical protein
MENPRTTAARDHDDSDVIDAAQDAPSDAGRSGGNMARDLSTQAEADRIDDPEGHDRVTKQRTIDHAESIRPDRTPDA